MTDNSKPAPERVDSGTAGEGEALPCLYSNISTEKPVSLSEISTQQRKTAFVLNASVQALADRFGLQHLGFLTLTFAEHILCPKEAQRRLNSLLSHVIKPRYREYLGVFERQKSGRIHYHLLVVLNQDIRTGCNFSEFQHRTYRSAPPGLRIEWAFWRKKAKAYGFGRTELLPIRSTTEAIGKYVGKYIAKHIGNRTQEDKGVRLVRYSKGARVGTTRFQFHSEGSVAWRRKVATFAEIVRSHHPDEVIEDITDLSRILGPRWAYHHSEFIHSLEEVL